MCPLFVARWANAAGPRIVAAMNRRFAGPCAMGALLATQLLGARPAAAAPTTTGFALNRYQPAQPGSNPDGKKG